MDCPNIISIPTSASIITIGKSPGKELSDETTPFSASQLNSHYARSKYETEQWVLEEAKKGFPVVIVNPGIVFGERDSTRKITHVGVSLGGWKMIHSSRGRNGVYVDDVQERPDLRDIFVCAGSFMRT